MENTKQDRTKINIADRVKNLLSSFIHNSNGDPTHEKNGKDENNGSEAEAVPSSSKLTAVKKKTDAPKIAVPSPFSARHEAFIQRVEGFSTLTWFGKPVELSPVQCARYGWENTGRDVVRCVSCREILCCQLPSPSHQDHYKSVLADCAKKLIQAHRMNCSWRVNPCHGVHLSEIVPDRTAALDQLQTRVAGLQNTQTLPPIDLEFTDSPMCVIDQLKQLLSDLDVKTDVSSSACVIALCGWTIRPKYKDILTCTYCCRKVGIWKYEKQQTAVNEVTSSSSDDVKDEHRAKKARLQILQSSDPGKFNPVTEHRYWCAWLRPSGQEMEGEELVGWRWYLYTLLPQLNPKNVRTSRRVIGDIKTTPPHQGLRSIRSLFRGWVSTEDLSTIKTSIDLSPESTPAKDTPRQKRARTP